MHVPVSVCRVCTVHLDRMSSLRGESAAQSLNMLSIEPGFGMAMMDAHVRVPL